MPGLITGKITLQRFGGEQYVDIEDVKGEILWWYAVEVI